MTFSRLTDKFESLVNKLDQGSSISEKLEKLQQLLEAKIARYEAKLAATENPEKRKKLETRLRVVTAQLEKSKNYKPPIEHIYPVIGGKSPYAKRYVFA